MKIDETRIRLSDIPIDTWMELVILNPSECSSQYVKGLGDYVRYKSYWNFDKDKKVFEFTLPAYKLLCALRALPNSARFDINKPILMVFKRDNFQNLSIREWRGL